MCSSSFGRARSAVKRVATGLLYRAPVLVALAWSALGASAEQPPNGSGFDVLEFQIEGNTLLQPAAVESAVYPFLGPDKGIEDVERARTALEQAYRKAGHAAVLVSIPEQQVSDGVVRLTVVESTIGRTRVQGARYYSQGQLIANARALQEGEVLNLPDVQKDLGQMNQSADRRVVPVLRPGPSFGTTDVDLKVDDRLPLHGSVELNNYYSPNTTELRLVGSARYDNLWQLGHSIGLQYQTSPQDTSQVKVFGASYVAPLPDDSSAGLYYIRSRSSVAAVGDIDVLGNGDIYGARWNKPLPPVGSYGQLITLGVDYKSFQDLVVQPGLPAVQTPIQYAPFVINYTGSIGRESSSTLFTTGVTFSVRGISGADEDFAQKRFNANSNFFIFKWDVQHTSSLPAGWSFHGELDGQIADQPLVSTEEYAAGGGDSVRGYLQAEALGDDALHGKLELRAPTLGPAISSQLQDLTPYLFVDGATLTIHDALPGETTRTTLLSAGIGLRARIFDGLTLRSDLGYAFRSTLYTDEGSVRLQFVAAYER